MDRKEIIEKITSKKEYSQLPQKDVELAFEKFDKDKYSDEEKIKLTRKLLREVFSSFASQKLLALKDKDTEWVLRKHVSTRERLLYYEEIYKKILKNLNGEITLFDLGAGVNGFSYKYFEKKINYIGVEAMKQLVDLINYYFKREKISGKAIHLSLFELEKIKKLIEKEKGKKVVFLFKTLDSLEMLERDYSKRLLKEIVPLVDRVIVSFAVKSMGKRTRFRAKRDWIIDFIKENFKMIDDFELGGEKYLVFNK